MKTFTEIWCDYHGQVIYNAMDRAEHQTSACNLRRVKTPIIDARTALRDALNKPSNCTSPADSKNCPRCKALDQFHEAFDIKGLL